MFSFSGFLGLQQEHKNNKTRVMNPHTSSEFLTLSDTHTHSLEKGERKKIGARE